MRSWNVDASEHSAESSVPCAIEEPRRSRHSSTCGMMISWISGLDSRHIDEYYIFEFGGVVLLTSFAFLSILFHFLCS